VLKSVVASFPGPRQVSIDQIRTAPGIGQIKRSRRFCPCWRTRRPRRKEEPAMAIPHAKPASWLSANGRLPLQS